jgi:hypothetical protein
VLLAAVLTAGLGACGGDDGDDTASDDTPGGTSSPGSSSRSSSSGGSTAGADFCEGFVALDQAFATPPEDPAGMEAFLSEQVAPALDRVRSDVPAEVAEPVGTMVATADEVVASGDMSAFEDPAFASAQGEVYPQLGGLCGFEQVDVTAVDDGYEGFPAQLAAGTAVVTLDNASAAGELHEMVLIKLAEGDRTSLDDLFAMSEEEAADHFDPTSPPVAVLAAADQVGGTSVELTPGRYVYACFIPVGTTSFEAEGAGPPHVTEGMAGELAVT